MPSTTINNQKLDARPDRIDYRDRPYQPNLISLPERYPHPDFIEKYFPIYAGSDLVLDQLAEGSCTGFGLAVVVNYLLWKRRLETETHVDFGNPDFLLRSSAVLRQPPSKSEKFERVSQRMFYHMARIYDEWPGEDYEGSSCRGAMKGWHKHGVTTEAIWPYFAGKKAKFKEPAKGWQLDAAQRPLGAYYRINADSVNDMQSAIHEVGAIYVSASVHDGWSWQQHTRRKNQSPLVTDDKTSLTVIPMNRRDETGGHAFAIVGYTPLGFIVQNSWGPEWGLSGFAIMSYADWVQHGTDAWVAVLGAPMSVEAPRTRSTMSLRDVSVGKSNWWWQSESTKPGFHYANPATEPWDEEVAYMHTVVLGNDGVPINHFLDKETTADAVAETVFKLPLDWLSEQDKPRLAIYAHGGLNSESASINRVRALAPFFKANGIYPVFVTWRTGFLESIDGILEDAVAKYFAPAGAPPAKGFLNDLKQQISDARDGVIEAACERVLVKAVWSQMKQNAEAARNNDGGLSLITTHLTALKKKLPNLELHLVGHSAGSILLGHLLDELTGKLSVSTLSLYAPACTVAFANGHYVPAVNKQVVAKSDLFFDIMNEERERADTVASLYGKSLLYLVSRALEDLHKMPLLGMQWTWEPKIGGATEKEADIWNAGQRKEVDAWQKFIGPAKSSILQAHANKTVNDGEQDIALAHGSFDNDIEVVSATLKRMRGGKLLTPVTNLHGF
jgi:hypothetical protein